MVRPLVYILVLNWNSPAYTVRCVESLLHLHYSNYRILLIDNGSTDGSEAVLRARFPDLAFLQTGDNLGYAGGNNRGVAYALERGADYLWILNNDTCVDPRALEALVEAVEKDEGIGLAGSKIRSMDDPDRLVFAGGQIDFWQGKSFHRGHLEADSGQYDRLEDVSFVTGCSLFFRASLIEQVGLMRETYFLYCEDVEWNLRIQKAGYRTVYVPGSVLWHKEGGSAGTTRAERLHPDVVYYCARNGLYFFKEAFPVPQRWTASLWHLFENFRLLVSLFRRRDPRFAEYSHSVFQAFADYCNRVSGRRQKRLAGD
ncbi:MAG: glycosyltransferase family 2 protein [Gemmatimonadaceae bacterium]|nr:glycosyltransferase family 2 protein [Gloeobacterales cyanobacterium ES-bin-141]